MVPELTTLCSDSEISLYWYDSSVSQNIRESDQLNHDSRR